ncbi:MAG: dihydroorotase [Bacteroidota bacterium]
MSSILIRNANIVNEGNTFRGHVLIRDGLIDKISESEITASATRVIDAKGTYLLPGLIDDQVHFREPGLTHKAEIYTEARAAVAGGITSFMEMPNTVPNTLTQELLEQKYRRAAEVSLANYSFFMGASNENIEEVLRTDPASVCGVKVFMGSSTGNMLVDNRATLEGLFSRCKLLIATHCEDESTIRANLETFRAKYGDDIPVECHPLIRSAEACYRSSSLAVELAKKYHGRLHILHISTEKELSLFDNTVPLSKKRITAEACVHHLWFTDEDYSAKGNLIKWNPAVKTKRDRDAVLKGVLENRIDVICTDHAPHTLEEKNQAYAKAPSGGPLVQHALAAMLELAHQKKLTVEKVAEKMSHAVADCFQVDRRGYIREGYFADLVLVDMNAPWTVARENILYKCGWSPFEGTTFRSRVTHTFVNGHLTYSNGRFDESVKGSRLLFKR